MIFVIAILLILILWVVDFWNAISDQGDGITPPYKQPPL